LDREWSGGDSVELKVTRGDLYTVDAKVLILFHFEGEESWLRATEEVNRVTEGLVGRVIGAGDFRGEHLENFLLYVPRGLAAERVLLSGLGKRQELSPHRLREAAAQALKTLRERRLASAVLVLPEGDEFPIAPADTAEACALGGLLGLYQFTALRTKEREKIREFSSLVLMTRQDPGELTARVAGAEAISRGVDLARDLVTLPGNLATPQVLAEKAREVALQAGLRYRTIHADEARELGMGAFLAVARGSDEPAVFVEMEYRPEGQQSAPVVLVGKGITFDSGGISIKPAENMEAMKDDMAGAAAVIGTMQVVAGLRLPLAVVALIPCTENLPSGKAYKPGDVIRSLSGQTIEVISTDAEGRLILADALSYAGQFTPQAVIDLATLTGACVVALGNGVSGLMGNDDDLLARVQAAAEKSGEKVWPLPLWDTYFELLKSEVADVKNVGGRKAGAITGGLFLKQFVPQGVPWAHLDIAGSAWEEKDRPLVPKGASGVGVHLLTRLLQDWKPLGGEALEK
jgi:leucyl aminopeptidase